VRAEDVLSRPDRCLCWIGDSWVFLSLSHGVAASFSSASPLRR
jgi:hypothetical protein